MTMTKVSLDTGQQAEELACAYLQKHKLRLIARNYHCRRGEIDLIMQDGNTLVFIEVRYRKSSRFGSALESVHTHKQQKIIFTAEHYLQHTSAQYTQYRFDVLAISPGHTAPYIQWIKNAFQLSG